MIEAPLSSDYIENSSAKSEPTPDRFWQPQLSPSEIARRRLSAERIGVEESELTYIPGIGFVALYGFIDGQLSIPV